MRITRNVTRCVGQGPGHPELGVLTWGFTHELCLGSVTRAPQPLAFSLGFFSLPVRPLGCHLQGVRRLHPVPRGLLRLTGPGEWRLSPTD